MARITAAFAKAFRRQRRFAVSDSESLSPTKNFRFEEPIVPDPSRHAESRNWIESLARHIPGFKGYLEKEYRRDSDHLARTWIADQLQKSKTALDRGQHSLL